MQQPAFPERPRWPAAFLLSFVGMIRTPLSRFDEPYRLGRKTVRGRLVIPSGIRCTHAATIRKCFFEIPSVGVITTKSVSAQPRQGYREPIFARYAPGCYINAVGLANPGAQQFLAEFDGVEIPDDKFLLVSIFGSDVKSFLEAALTLKPIADGFELNMSCPHAKGHGADIGQDTELLLRITEAVVRVTQAPVFVKLSAILPDLGGTSAAALRAGATGITVTNTIGPALAAVGEHPVLNNRLGGLSGDGIRPLGLRAVEQVRQAVGSEPVVIGLGGIASPEHVRQYARAGADLFGIGSALTGLDSEQMRQYLAQLHLDLCRDAPGQGYERSCESRLPMEYFKTRIRSRANFDGSLFKLVLESLPENYGDGDLAGKFFFLCVPGVGEKPFAIFSSTEKSVIVRVAGEFTRHLAGLPAGAEILLRGPYGRGLPRFENSTLVYAGGGTGIASLLEIACRLKPGNKPVFLLGAKTRQQLFDLDKFERLGPVFLATDDGSAGRRGLVSELLPEVIAGMPAAEKQQAAFINCGPEPMVWKCFDIQREVVPDDRIIGSIEYMTSCGVGVCGKCSSPSGALTCIDGPFMPWRDFQPLRSGEPGG